MRHAVIDTDGQVANVVLWDGESDWPTPEGMTVVALDDDSPVQPGDVIDTSGKLITRAAPEVTPMDALKRLLIEKNVLTEDEATALP